MKRLFKVKYPKTFCLVLAIVFAYLFFSNPQISARVAGLGAGGYLGMFIAGMLFSFGFTTPFAVGFFVMLHPENIFISAIIGGIGAAISDLIIFHFIKFSFEDEFRKIKKETKIGKLSHSIEKKISRKALNYLLYVFAGIVISSPLPDELGVMMLAGLTKIDAKTLAIIGFIFNTLGILVMLSI